MDRNDTDKGQRLLDPIAQDEKRLLDARMEYGHLITYYIALENMFWVAYGAFFTINTLLVTGLAFTYADAAQIISDIFIRLARVIIPIIGTFISIGAMVTARKISKMQGLAVKRGCEIEENVLSANAFHLLRPNAGSFP